MNGLALYSGITGIELGLKIAVSGYRTVCYVEREAYPAAITVKLMEEKVLDEAIVWDDAETFDGTAWRGKVDIISAGFPCQPVSVAGKRKGHKDRRWQWPTVRRIVCEVRPSFVFLENVPGIKPYIPGITADLTEIGYRWTYGFFSAAGCGAPHKRVRWFLLAYASSQRTRLERQNSFDKEGGDADPSKSEILRQGDRATDAEGLNSSGKDVANASSERLEKSQEGEESQSIFPTEYGSVPNSKQTGLEGAECEVMERTREGGYNPDIAGSDWWSVEPDLGRVAHGVPFRVDRLRALGNAVVPIVAATAWRILLARLFEAGMIGAYQANWDEIIGIEIDPEYCKIAKARLKFWTRQQRLNL